MSDALARNKALQLPFGSLLIFSAAKVDTTLRLTSIKAARAFRGSDSRTDASALRVIFQGKFSDI